MISEVVAAIKSVIDLLMLRKKETKLDLDIKKARLDVTKTGLEIEKQVHDKATTESVIITPDKITVEDIQKYDPKARTIVNLAERVIRSQQRFGAPSLISRLIWIVTLLALGAYLVRKLL
jgi:hypothetical protein